jgi:hypothetical protein
MIFVDIKMIQLIKIGKKVRPKNNDQDGDETPPDKNEETTPAKKKRKSCGRLFFKADIPFHKRNRIDLTKETFIFYLFDYLHFLLGPTTLTSPLFKVPS